MSTKSTCLFLIATIAIVWRAAPAAGQVVLKPAGRDAVPLHTKAVAADVLIDRQLATTRLTLTFLNETADRIEADFIYALPPDTLVTSFAYWYGQEKVVGKIVEKEEAAAIYAHITTRMRDPALVEMIGKRTFRARIFPVMPNQDLKVEMTMAQAMPSNEKGGVYTLPLRADRGAALDSVQVNVRVKADADIARVTDNYGLPAQRRSGEYRIALAGINYRPQQDLRVSLIRKAQPLHAALYAARASGPDGFFALTLTPDRTLTRPQVRIDGIAIYDVVPSDIPSVQAHHALTLCGRYRGSGQATVTLTGLTPHGRWISTQPVVFDARSVPNNAAAKLWAARWMDKLSADNRNREAVIALSKRFGMPSKFTSWLAVPKEEMERYLQERLAAQIEVTARRLAAQISAGHENSRTARQLRLRLNALCAQNHTDPREALQEQLGDELDRLARDLSDRIAHEQDHTAAGRRLRARFDLLCRITGTKPADVLQSDLDETLVTLSRLIVETRHSERPNTTRLAYLQRQFHRVEHASGRSAKDYIDREEEQWIYVRRESIRDQLFAEYRQDEPNPARVRRLRQQYLALTTKDNVSKDFAEARLKRLEVHADQEKVSRAIEIAQRPATTTQLAELKELQEQENALRLRMGDPLISIEAPADAQQVIALMPGGEIKRLEFNSGSRRWEARFDIPSYAAEGEYVITVIIVLRDGTRKTISIHYHVDLTPPSGTGAAQVVSAGEPALRLQLDASEDTARIKALLPWGELVELKPSAQPHRFFALVPLPAERRSVPPVVKFILTDRAHNRTTILVDMTKN